MPDKRSHRGPHPNDAQLFASEEWPRLRLAVSDLSWLLDRGYAAGSAIKLVGDRFSLEQRQRIAVSRCTCSNEARDRRQRTRLQLARLNSQPLLIDGFNVLTSIEAALAGGVILHARDGCFRDMASVHGTWRRVEETVRAVEMVGQLLAEHGIDRTVWYLDRPVSNSGRLKTILRKTAEHHSWSWDVELVPNPDRNLSLSAQPVATADSGILDVCRCWVNLARAVIEDRIPHANIVRFGEITTAS